MAKAIKRVGIIFLAVAIICLLAVGVLIGQNKTNSVLNNSESSLNSSNKIENINETSEEELPPIVEEIFLDGATCEEQVAKWNEAITKSLANGGNQHILVTMKNDWIAPTTGNHEFGAESVGINVGRIFIPKNAIVTLDLNGCTIDRRLTSAAKEGTVVRVSGVFTLKDSCFDYAKIMQAYNANHDIDLGDYIAGKITGGYNKGWGGGIIIEGGKLIVESGAIYKNSASGSGGGICNSTSFLTINNGVIANNYAGESGGGVIYSDNQSAIGITTINGGIFHQNIAQGYGGALFATYGRCNITGGIFSHNSVTNDRAEGGAIFFTHTQVKITGGLLEYNSSAMCGGAIRLGEPECIAYVENIIVRHNYAKGYAGGIRFANDLAKVCTIKNCTITNNSTDGYGGGMTVEFNTIFGAGMQVYDNVAKGATNNVYFYIPVVEAQPQIIIEESLLKDGKSFYCGITLPTNYTLSAFTSGYTSGGNNTLDPSRFFFSDKSGLIVKKSSAGEAQLVAGTKPTSNITWKYDNQSTTKSSVILPYKQGGYRISSNLSSIKNSSGTASDSFVISEAGSHAFYADGNYLNPTFMVTIEEPIAKIEKPTNKSYTLFYNGKHQTFIPENFNSGTMDISYNVKKDVGKYTAKVSLKNARKTTWSDGSTDSVEYSFEIVSSGVELKKESQYDFIYLENGNRKSYKTGNYEHKVNDSEIATINGNTRYVLGNISCETSVKTFIGNLQNESNKIKIYDNNSTIIYDGIASNGVVADNLNNKYVATGYKVEYYWNNNLYDTAYISVLGDVVADGIINTLDVTFINRIARGNVDFESLSLERQLAAMVDNKGKVTSTDGKILLNVIGGNLMSQDYFGNIASNKDNYQLWNLKEEGGKLLRESIDITTAGLVDKAIIGNISPETKAVDFKIKLANQLGIDISAISVHKSNGEVANNNEIIGTGYYINYNGNTGNKIYLSVLGDLTGDGRVNTTDVTYLNRLVNGSITLDTSNIKDKLTMLAATIQNKGKLTTADSETILNYIGNNVDIKQYF